jgi:TRAP-type C4-dicarboxylate transport system permease small subunit
MAGGGNDVADASAARREDQALPPEGALGRVAARISYLSAVVAAAMTVFILVIICTEVGLRFFKRSLLVSDEIAGYLNAALVFLGLAYTLREGGFIRVELLYDRLQGGMRLTVRWFIVITSFIYTAILLYYAIGHVHYSYRTDTRAVSVIDTPEWIPQVSMVIGLAVLLLQLLAFIVDRVRRIP